MKPNSNRSMQASEKLNREFLKKTPSIKDLDVQALIKKHPLLNSNKEKEACIEKRRLTSNIIDMINDELTSQNTLRYCNYVNMGMM